MFTIVKKKKIKKKMCPKLSVDGKKGKTTKLRVENFPITVSQRNRTIKSKAEPE